MNQAELTAALQTALKGTAQNSTLPILNGVYIEAAGDEVCFQATNLELSVKYTAPALVEEPGNAVLPGKVFGDIAKSLPNEAVQVETSQVNGFVSCGHSLFSLHVISGEDFPEFPTIEAEQTIDISFPVFCSMVRKVARAVSKDKSRAVLTGVLIEKEDDRIRMVATDSYRLALVEAVCPGEEAAFQAVVAGSFLQDIASLTKTEEPVSIGITENQVVLRCMNTTFINRRIEGSFPNYRQLLSNNYATKVTLATEDLLSSVKRSSLLNSGGSPIKMEISQAEQHTTVFASAQGVGSSQESIPCKVEGEDVQIAFNCLYMLDGISVIDEEEIALYIQSSLKPGIMKTSGDVDYTYLIMPIRITE